MRAVNAIVAHGNSVRTEYVGGAQPPSDGPQARIE
jgi:hypothetical protein